MTWIVYLAHFFAGAFLTNGVPHFVNGVSGRRFPSPFASPPGRGASRPVVNVLWGLVNFLAGVLLLVKVGPVNPASTLDSLSVGAGIVAMAIVLAIYFGSLQNTGRGGN